MYIYIYIYIYICIYICISKHNVEVNSEININHFVLLSFCPSEINTAFYELLV